MARANGETKQQEQLRLDREERKYWERVERENDDTRSGRGLSSDDGLDEDGFPKVREARHQRVRGAFAEARAARSEYETEDFDEDDENLDDEDLDDEDEDDEEDLDEEQSSGWGGNHASFQHNFIWSSTIPGEERVVAVFLSTNAKDGFCWYDREDISEKLGMGKGKFFRLLASLKERGLVRNSTPKRSGFIRGKGLKVAP